MDPARAARSPIVFLLAAVLFINYVDRGALPTATHLIQGDLHLNFTQMGMLLSAFSWTYTCSQIPVGWLAERYGAHRILAAGLILWASATILVGFAHTFAMLLVLRLMLGIGESAGFPCVAKIMAATVPPKGLGTANGIVALGYLSGPVVGTLLGGLLMAHFGWRSAFWVFGSLSLLWLLPWSRAARGVRAAVSAGMEDSPTLWMILKQPSLWGTALGLFSSNYTFYFMLNWLPGYLQTERGFSLIAMTQLATLAFAVNAASAFLAGWAIDKYLRRGGSANFGYKSVMAVAHVGSVICMLAMAVGSLKVALIGVFVFQALSGASSPGVYAMCQILAGPRASGRWVGIQNSLGNLPGIIAPWLTGYIVDRTGHFTVAFVVAAVMSMLGVIGWILMVPRLAELKWKHAAAPGRRAGLVEN
jgi:MFS family permease